MTIFHDLLINFFTDAVYRLPDQAAEELVEGYNAGQVVESHIIEMFDKERVSEECVTVGTFNLQHPE